MQFYEKLEELVGHQVVTATNQPEQGNATIPQGIIKELGADYLVIQTPGGREGGYAKTAEWFVRLDAIVYIVHMHDCKKCRK